MSNDVLPNFLTPNPNPAPVSPDQSGSNQTVGRQDSSAPQTTDHGKRFSDELFDKKEMRRDLPTEDRRLASNVQESMAQAGIPVQKSQLKALGESLGKGPELVRSTPVLSFLTGHLEQLEPSSIPDLLASNSFLQDALAQGDILAFLQTPMPLADLLDKLEIDPRTLANLQRSQMPIDLSATVTPSEFFKSIGIDPQRVFVELTQLKSNLQMEGASPYMKRAAALRGGQKETSSPSKVQAKKPDTQNKDSKNQSSKDNVPAGAVPLATALSTLKDQPANLVADPDAQGVTQGGQQAKAEDGKTATSGNVKKPEPSSIGAVPAQKQMASPAGDTIKNGLADLVQKQGVKLDMPNLTEKPMTAPIASSESVRVDLQKLNAQEILNSSGMAPERAAVKTAFVDPYLAMARDIEAAETPIIMLDDGQIQNVRSPSDELIKNLMERSGSSLPSDASTLMASGDKNPIAFDPRFFANLEKGGASRPMGAMQLGPVLSRGLETVPLDNSSSPVTLPANKTDITEALLASRISVFDRGSEESSPKGGFSDHQNREGLKDNLSNATTWALGGHAVNELGGKGHAGTFAIDDSQGAASANLADPSQMAKQVMDKATMMVRNGGGSMRMDLGSPELGRIDLAVNVDSNQVAIRILTSSDKVRDVLRQDLHKLQETLSAQNLQLSKVELTSDSGSRFQGGSGGSHQGNLGSWGGWQHQSGGQQAWFGQQQASQAFDGFKQTREFGNDGRGLSDVLGRQTLRNIPLIRRPDLQPASDGRIAVMA